MHGLQEERFFYGYYDGYCFLPLYVFFGEQLLVSYLRPSNLDGVQHSWTIFASLVKRLRQVWPEVRLIFRADSGFCRDRMLRWCERHKVGYIVGTAKNSRLLGLIDNDLALAKQCACWSDEPLRYSKELTYAAGPWKGLRRVIAKIEHLSKGATRYIVTNLKGPGQLLLGVGILCAEQDGKPHQRTATGLICRSDQLPSLMGQSVPTVASAAYMLMERLRAQALVGTQLARAQVTTIRLKLLQIGAVVVRNTRRVACC